MGNLIGRRRPLALSRRHCRALPVETGFARRDPDGNARPHRSIESASTTSRRAARRRPSWLPHEARRIAANTCCGSQPGRKGALSGIGRLKPPYNKNADARVDLPARNNARSAMPHSPSARCLCSSCISSAMLALDRRTSSANGAFGLHERHESAGMRLVTAASRLRSSIRRSTSLIVRQAGQRTHRNQKRAAIAAPIVGEKSIGIGGDPALGILEHVRLGGAPASRLRVGLGLPICLKLTLVVAHGWIVGERIFKSTGFGLDPRAIRLHRLHGVVA